MAALRSIEGRSDTAPAPASAACLSCLKFHQDKVPSSFLQHNALIARRLTSTTSVPLLRHHHPQGRFPDLASNSQGVSSTAGVDSTPPSPLRRPQPEADPRHHLLKRRLVGAPKSQTALREGPTGSRAPISFSALQRCTAAEVELPRFLTTCILSGTSVKWLQLFICTQACICTSSTPKTPWAASP